MPDHPIGPFPRNPSAIHNPLSGQRNSLLVRPIRNARITTTISNYAIGRGTPREFQILARVSF